MIPKQSKKKRKQPLRIFVSSTREDLLKHRQAVLNTIDSLELKQVAMESFGARPEEPIDVCLKHVRRSDMVVLILAHKYGSVVPGRRMSFTQAEYEEARLHNKLCFIYLIDDMVKIPSNMRDEGNMQTLLNDFKHLLRTKHLINSFLDPEDLAQKVAKDLKNYLVGGESRLLPEELEEKQRSVLSFINVYRSKGYQKARINPLKMIDSSPLPEFNPDYWGFEEDDLKLHFSVGSMEGKDRLRLSEILSRLESLYCGMVGWDFMHIETTEEKRWLQHHIETDLEYYKTNNSGNLKILSDLIAAEHLEHYLQSRYPGKIRFSLEGVDMLLPLLRDLIEYGGCQGISDIVVGSTHRGRINLLVNLWGVPAAQLMDTNAVRAGRTREVSTEDGPVRILLTALPLEPELVGACVLGMVRGIQQERNDRLGNSALGIILHGDTTFSSYGAVYEQLALSQMRGFNTGGTIHVVINNGIGFTTSNPLDTRSTLFCTDIAKSGGIPIFHVNADEPEMLIAVGRLALDYRDKFRKDVIIDLVCYRRRGHTGIDEPSATQPLMYEKIQKHPSVIELYSKYLSKYGLLDKQYSASLIKGYNEKLDAGLPTSLFEQVNRHDEIPGENDFLGTDPVHIPQTAVTAQKLKTLCHRLTMFPEDFLLHHLVEHIQQNRIEMGNGTQSLDWGFAELIAYASLLDEGYKVRLVGKDVERGTFFQRHAVFHDVHTGNVFSPLSQFREDGQLFTVINATSSDQAVLAYEYGFATGQTDTLVVWEAQFPDSISAVQLIIDQLIAIAPVSYEKGCGLTLFVPYGMLWEGMGNVSGHLERFLERDVEKRIQISVPSTAAQLFHLLRCQAHISYSIPLIVMIAPGLFRMKVASSPLDMFSSGRFQVIIYKIPTTALMDCEEIILCSGDIYYELKAREDITSVIVSIEQLCPFPHQEITALLENFPSVQRIIWLQREASDSWAWHYLENKLARHFPNFHQTMRQWEK